MQEFTLEHYWMLGVMLIMVLYGGIALYGYHIKSDKKRAKRDAEE